MPNPHKEGWALQSVDKVSLKIWLSSLLTKDKIPKSLPPGGRCRVYEAEGARVQTRLLKKFCLRTILHLQTDKFNPKFLNRALSLSLLLRKIQLLHYASHNVQREPFCFCATFYF